jgi:hypothetical protein
MGSQQTPSTLFQTQEERGLSLFLISELLPHLPEEASLKCLKGDTLKATEANRRRRPGTREKVRSRRINLEGNTHAQEINVSQLPV